MKVIFIKDLRGQGKANDVKEVSDGYAINYLIKNGYAVKYTIGSSNRLSKELKEQEKQDKINMEKAKELKNNLEKLNVKFVMKAGKNGKLFGTISTKTIHEKLVSLGFNIDKKKIVIKTPINMLGSYQVDISLYKNISAKLTISICEE